MKTKKLSKLLLLFLCTINLIGCNNEETESACHLELTVNSCKIILGGSESVKLTAHENTTLDITDGEVADAVYTWGGNTEYASDIKITGKRDGETDIIVTDHETGETATIKVEVTKAPMPHLVLKKGNRKNVFDRMDFYLTNDGSQSITMGLLSEVCDSIVWTVNGQKGSYRLYERESGEGVVKSHLVMEWGHCFIFPGDYETCLTAWKDNKVLYQDILSVTIINDKDFLGFNWKDVTNTSQAWTSYADVIGSNPDLMTTYRFNAGVPSVEVAYFNVTSDKYLSQSYDVLYNYFCSFYSQPTYEDKKDKQKIFRLYKELFSEQKVYPNAYPCAIWVTDNANAVLLLDEDDSARYIVYAEPRQ